MLSAVERCVEEIGRVRGARVDLSRIPYDDAETYDAIQVADTIGVFQIESRAQMASLLRTRPQSLEDLTIQVAIVRPGPILGGAVNPYISRLQTLRENPDYVVPYEHESLRGVLKDTLGTIIFQDQVIEVAMAFAGFSPGEAEGLRRAMSRKRSAEAIEAYHQRFLDGAMATHGVDAEVAERVYGMIVGFSGFGFPKAHGAAFGLLAYQSTWLRVHHGPEFLCALMNEQPMGFYAPDTLAHEAQRRGIALAPPDVNASQALCTVEWVPDMGPPPDLSDARWAGAPGEPPAPEGATAARLRNATRLAEDATATHLAAGGGLANLSAVARSSAGTAGILLGAGGREPSELAAASRPAAAPPDGLAAAEAAAGAASDGAAAPPRRDAPAAIVRLGLGFILGVKEEEIKALVAAREEGGPFRSLADLASRAGAGRPSLDRLAWAGACDSLIGGSSEHARRTALWQLGVAVPGERLLEGTQLALPLEVPDAPALRPLTPWESMIGDYATTGLTLGPHPMQLLRPSLEPGTLSIGDLARLPHNTAVKLGGLVVARQRPGTAKGIVFLLLEDEFGTINLIVPPDLYESNRLTVRGEPLLLCEGRLEKLPQAGGGINVFVKGVRPLVAPQEQAAEVVALAEKRVAAAASGRGEGAQGGREAASTMGEFRQVSPPIQSFASGRRR
jgi:error-prone DNA polymerase